jgi:hypothetical protein
VSLYKAGTKWLILELNVEDRWVIQIDSDEIHATMLSCPWKDYMSTIQWELSDFIIPGVTVAIPWSPLAELLFASDHKL